MADLYRIGVNIALASNASGVLGALSRDLLHVNAGVGKLEKGFGRVKLAIGGAVAIAGGLALITAWKAPLDEARKFEMAATKFKTFGLGDARSTEAINFAKAMNIAGSSYIENMNRMSEAQGVFRDSGLTGDAALRGAKLAAPLLAKINFANSALDDETRAKLNTSSLAMLRFIEMKGGVNSPTTFNALADAGFKAIKSSGGNVNWELYRQFMATGGVAAQGLSSDALFGEFEPVIGELKSRAGTGLMTAFNRLTGVTRLPNQAAHELIAQGLWDKNRVVFNSLGGIKAVTGNPLKDATGFGADPFRWYMANVVPMYDRKGLSDADRNREDALLGGRTGGMMFSIFRRQHTAIEKSIGAQRQQFGIDKAYGAAGGTLNGKVIDLQAKYANLLERLGEAVLPLAVKGLTALIPVITGVTGWMAANPGAMRIIAKTTLIIGAAMIGLGIAAVGIAAFFAIWVGGPVVATVAVIGAVTGAVVAFVALNWGAVKGVFDWLVKTIGGLISFAGKATGVTGFAHWLFKGTGSKQSLSDIINDPNSGINRHTNAGPWGAAPTSSPYVASGGGARAGTPAGDVFLDSRKVGKVMWPNLANGLNGGAQTGGSMFDPGAALAAPGFGGR